jgi:hypothetical protein
MSTEAPEHLYKPPPCDGCELVVRCAAERVACRAFRHHASVGRARLEYRGAARRPLDAHRETEH